MIRAARERLEERQRAADTARGRAPGDERRPRGPDGKPRRWAKGDVEQGERLYASACAGCHGAKGQGAEGPMLANQVLLASSTDSYLAETIRRGRRGTAMLGFAQPTPARRALAASEIESIVTFMRKWEKPPEKKP